MGKLFGRKKRYSDEEYENEDFDDDMEDDESEDDDIDDDELEDDDIDEDELEDDDIDEDELENDDIDDDELEDDDDDEDELEDDDIDDDELEDDDIDEDELEDDDIDDDELEDDDIDDDELDDDDDDADDEEEWDEDERRIYRHRRRVRNQIIAYSVVLIFLLLVVLGCVSVGKKVVGITKAKKLAKEQEELLAKQQEEQEAQEAHDTVIDTPETLEPEPEPEEDYLGEIVEAYLADMPLEDKIAGLFVVKPEAITGVSKVTQAGDGTREALNTYAVGGLVYSRQNILNKEQLMEMLSNTVSMSRYPIFLAVEEEGGSNGQVAGSGIEVIQVDAPAAIGETGDTSQAYESGMMMGTYLNELGFNLDLAPVAEAVSSEDGVLGDRVFGSEAQMAGDMVSSMVEGIEGVGVSSCLKYFPGIGEAEGDTHAGRVETTRTLDEMRSYEFLPFQAGIDAGADFIMVGHITASAVDEEAVPSSLSEVVMTQILRNELGFQGVIITDALDMSAITEYYTSEQAVVMAIEAGADMLLMPEDFNAAYEALLAAVQDGTISEGRINESLERIYRVKCAGKLEQ